jgi:putative phage-type endonuclease
MNKRSSKMLINQDFSVDRTKYIGGSDIGAILGLSRFKTPLEVWMEKTGKDVKKADSLPLRFGSFAESFVANEYSRATGFELLHDESAHIHPNHSYMSAHIDRFVLSADQDKSPTRILECKTASPFTSSDWGEAGSDEVPMSYLCQCVWYMAITGIEQCDLAVLFGNSDFRIYEITRDKALEEMVVEKAATFWNDFILKDLPPLATSIADCQSLYSKGNPERSVQATMETLELTKRLHLLVGQIDTLEEEVSSIKQSIMTQMGEAETLTFQNQVLATWKAPKPSFRLDSKKLEVDYPDLVGVYKTPVQNSRRLVIKHYE